MKPPANSLSIRQTHRQTAVLELDATLKERGYLPEDVVREVAQGIGLSTGSMRRLLREYRKHDAFVVSDRDTRKKELSKEAEELAKDAFFRCAGDATRTYEFLLARNVDLNEMSLRTFQRRIGESWDPALVAGAQGGYRAMVAQGCFNTEVIPYRMYALGMDHTRLPIQAIPEVGNEPVWLWLTTVLDLATRVVLGWLLSETTPAIENSISALADAVRGFDVPGRGFVGGLPEFLRSDRGGDFVSNAFSKGLFRLDVQRQFTDPYSSWQNGHVERLNGTIDRDFCPTQSGFFRGGIDEYDRRVLKVPLPIKSLLITEHIAANLRDWFWSYNNREHRSLNGQTPLDAWFNDPHPVQRADPAVIRAAMQRTTKRRVNKYGIDFQKEIFKCPEFGTPACPVESSVEVRYLGHFPETLEVYSDGTFIGTATIARKVSQSDQMAIVRHRREQKKEFALRKARSDYAIVLDERELLRAQGVPDDELPMLPPDPVETVEKMLGRDGSTSRTARADDNDDGTYLNHRPATQREIDQLLKELDTA